jgi:kinesin family member 2/24
MNNIKIFSRIKPNANNNADTCVFNNNDTIIVKKQQKAYLNNYIVDCNYKLDKVFDDKCANMDIYNYISIEILRSILKYNKNATFYVYGQTGSGKTHTILGDHKIKGKEEEGFVSLILRDILDINYPVSVTLVEIYNNKCYDILNNKRLIHQRENHDKKFVMCNIQKKDIKTKQDIAELNHIILENRQTGISSENNTSSRSHLQINIEFNNHFLKIMDLAGCEKAKVSICANRDSYKENGEINQSLFALKECIRALVDKKPHIPYRKCELTKMLRQSFDPESKTYVLSTVSQDVYNSNTTIDVLNYITDMKKIKCVQKRQMPKIPKPVPRQLQQLPSIKEQYAIGSPKYNMINSNKHILQKLSNMETNVLHKILDRKSSKDLFDNYTEILEKKRKILMNENIKKQI